MLLAPLAAQAEGFGVPALMAELASVRSGQAHFTERRTMALTPEPLQSQGFLRYWAPDRLEKQTLAPTPGDLLIEGDMVTVSQAGQPTRSISLRATPELAALVSGLRATMAGDLATLQRYYTLRLQGEAADWQLDLVPLDQRMKAVVAGIRISGSGATLRRVVTEEAGGDRSEMLITPDAP